MKIKDHIRAYLIKELVRVRSGITIRVIEKMPGLELEVVTEGDVRQCVDEVTASLIEVLQQPEVK